MKKFILTAVIALFAVTAASAQYRGEWGVSPKIGIYTNANFNGAIVGIGAGAQYSITDNWRIAPSLLALCEDNCSIDFSFDVHYLFNVARDLHVYPLVGVSANDFYDWSCGINVGGGVEYAVADNWDVSGAVKWMIQTADDYTYGWKRTNPIVITLGATYRF